MRYTLRSWRLIQTLMVHYHERYLRYCGTTKGYLMKAGKHFEECIICYGTGTRHIERPYGRGERLSFKCSTCDGSGVKITNAGYKKLKKSLYKKLKKDIGLG